MGTSRRALIIGIQNYETLPKLDYACEDANLIYNELSDYNCQFSCTLLIEKAATAKKLRDEFKGLFVGADDDATLVFYFAGHGVTIDNATYLVTIDKEDDIEAGIDFGRLVDLVNFYRKPKQSCIFLLDCCHAGAMPAEQLNLQLEIIEDAVSHASGVALIAATESNEVALESSQLRQGIFTSYLFFGLTGDAANNEGKITIASLYEYVAAAMSQTNGRQKPVLKTNLVGLGPIIGEGFKPQQEVNPSKLTESQLQHIESTIRNRLQQVRRNLDVDQTIWTKREYKETSILLTELIEWKHELERSHPELKDSQLFKSCENEINMYQRNLSLPQPDTILPRGKLVREIGSGGFGSVYIVETDQGLEAYKIYHADQLRDRPKVKAFQRGYRAMKKLNHPNIVKVSVDTKAPLGFFMQYIDGANFRDWWSDGQLTLLNILYVIAQTLEYAHRCEVIHRDIKPENIIIDAANPEKPIPFLTDFDLSWYSMATTFSVTGDEALAAFGHYLYAAPEQYESPGADITRKNTTDVYGFGQLCYFAVTGKDPARDTSTCVATLQSRLGEWPLAEAANKFIQIYSKCTKRKPSERYQSMAEVSSDLLMVRNLFADPGETRLLSQDQFISELAFSLFGLEQTPLRVFLSRSGQTQVDLQTITSARLEIKFDVMQGYVGQTGSIDQQRNTITQRVDNAITAIKRQTHYDIFRHSERHIDIFSTRIDLPGNHLTLSGVRVVRQIILDVIDCIEA